MGRSISAFVRLAYALEINIDEMYDVLNTRPCFGHSSRILGIDDYDSIDRESMEYEISIIKRRYRK